MGGLLAELLRKRSNFISSQILALLHIQKFKIFKQLKKKPDLAKYHPRLHGIRFGL